MRCVFNVQNKLQSINNNHNYSIRWRTSIDNVMQVMKTVVCSYHPCNSPGVQGIAFPRLPAELRGRQPEGAHSCPALSSSTSGNPSVKASWQQRRMSGASQLPCACINQQKEKMEWPNSSTQCFVIETKLMKFEYQSCKEIIVTAVHSITL